jgi:sporulation protein YlmC with PRC-barrel domain
MLMTSENLSTSHIEAIDGHLGKIKDVYFDDQHWTVRYMVVDTHKWLPLSQRVLVSPVALIPSSLKEEHLKVSLSRELIENCPRIDERETVSREYEKLYFDYFGYAYYWTGSDAWGQHTYPSALFERDFVAPVAEEEDKIEEKNHLRSAVEIEDYDVEASNGNKGRVRDFIWETDTWSLQALVIDTSNWLSSGKSVVIDISHITSIDWMTKTVKCKLSVEEILACPEFDGDKLN